MIDDLMKKISPILTYVGIIGASITSIAYMICVFVLIKGFQQQAVLQTTIFAIVNAIVGFVIMQFLKVQGVSFAKTLPENKEVIKEYYATKTKGKKLHSITFYWVTSIVKDVIIKAGSILITTIGMIYIVIEGSNDWNLLSLAIVNLLMFISFGLLSLNSAYEFYNNNHIQYMKNKIQESKNNDNQGQCSVQELGRASA